MPIIMDTFKENLLLKNVVDINERLDPKNFEQKENYCRIMVEILGKLDESIENRKIMGEKFERLCLWKGMKSGDIKVVEEEVKESRLVNQKKMERLELELEEVRQENGHLKKRLEFEIGNQEGGAKNYESEFDLGGNE